MKKWIFLASILVAAGIVFFLKQPSSTSQPAAVESQANMVLVPKGDFLMGSNDYPNALPARTVSLSDDFYIGKFEVTNQEYADMLNYAFSKGNIDKAALESKGNKRGCATGVSKNPQKYQDVTDEHSQLTFENGVFKPLAGKENYPVVEVTWYGAAFYCNMISEKEGLAPLYNLDDWSCQVYGKTGYRLPTEAEWQYAAKYNDDRKYPWGSEEPDSSYATVRQQIKDPVEVATTPVGSFSPKGDSKLGICDMVGNVAEWCNDWYNDVYIGAKEATDPVGPEQSMFYYLPFFKEFRSARVVHGGCFLYDANYRKEYGVPFIIDSVVHAQALNNNFRCFDINGFSRQVEGFRAVKTVATGKTKAVFTSGQK